MRISRALLVSTVLPACTPEGPWEGYLPTEPVSLDCRVLPEGSGLLHDPARPDELLGDALYSLDFGATWDRWYDGTAESGASNVFPLGDGLWLGFDPAPTNREGRLLSLPDGRVRPVALQSLLGGPEGLRGAQLDDDSWYGIDVRGRTWRSPDGAFGSWVGLDSDTAVPGAIRTVARGDRVWHVRLDGTLEVSTDGGITYTPRATPTLGGTPTTADDLALGPNGEVLVSAHTWMWTSEDDGTTWTVADAPPDFVARQGVGTVTAVGDDVYAEADLNSDAAAPNPPGFYLLHGADFGASWSVLRLDDGLDGLPYPLGTQVWERDGGLALAVFRPSGDRALCVSSGTPGTRDDAVVAPPRTLDPVTVEQPLDLAAWPSTVHVAGTAAPGSTVIATLVGSDETFRGGRVEADAISAAGTTLAGDDGRYALNVAFPVGVEPRIGSAVELQVRATDGYVSTPAVYRDLLRGGTPVTVQLEAPTYSTRTFDVHVTGTPDAALALYEGAWSGPTLNVRPITEAPSAIPASGELTTQITLTLPLGGVFVYALAEIPGSLGLARRDVLIDEPPPFLLPPGVALVLFDVVTTGFYVNVLTVPYATFDWTLVDDTDATLASDTGVSGGGARPDWVGFPVDYPEPASGTRLRLRVIQDVLGTRSPAAELVLTQQ